MRWGWTSGGQLKAQAVEIDPDLFAPGLKTMLAGGKTLLTEAEAKAAISQLQLARVAKQTAALQASGAKNKTEGEVFLAANKAKDGVVTLRERGPVQGSDGRHRAEADPGTDRRLPVPRHPHRRQGVR